MSDTKKPVKIIFSFSSDKRYQEGSNETFSPAYEVSRNGKTSLGQKMVVRIFYWNEIYALIRLKRGIFL